jgi:hypothetical protein
MTSPRRLDGAVQGRPRIAPSGQAARPCCYDDNLGEIGNSTFFRKIVQIVRIGRSFWGTGLCLDGAALLQLDGRRVLDVLQNGLADPTHAAFVKVLAQPQ